MAVPAKVSLMSGEMILNIRLNSVYSSILLNILRIGHLLSVGVDGSSDAILVTHRASPSDGFDAQFRRQMILAVLVLEFHLIVEQSEDRSHVFL